MHIIFDFDGTLADTFPVVSAQAKELGKRYRCTIDPESIREKGIRESFKLARISVWKVPFLIKDILKIIESSELKPFEGIPAAIIELSQMATLGIVSSSSAKAVDRFLLEEGIKDKFAFVHCKSALFGKHKDLIDLKKKHKMTEAYYVGDEDRDIEAAKKAGMKSISVTWGYNSEILLRENKPDFMVSTPGQLVELLQ